MRRENYLDLLIKSSCLWFNTIFILCLSRNDILFIKEQDWILNNKHRLLIDFFVPSNICFFAGIFNQFLNCPLVKYKLFKLACCYDIFRQTFCTILVLIWSLFFILFLAILFATFRVLGHVQQLAGKEQFDFFVFLRIVLAPYKHSTFFWLNLFDAKFKPFFFPKFFPC